MQTTVPSRRGEQWAAIDNVNFSCSPQKATIDDTLGVTVGFRISGGLRRNFVRKLWEQAYDEHDTGFRLGFSVTVTKNRPLPLRNVKIREDKFVRRAVFFWTRNPELPYRVWSTIATEFETILYPKTETEAQGMLFDVTRSFEIPASKLGKGTHTLGAEIQAKWGKHIFTDTGRVRVHSPGAKVRVD